jgi:hypothetical protein
MVFNENILLGDLLSNEAATAVLEKYLPGLSTNPMIGFIQAYTLKQIAEYPQTNLSEDKVTAIIAVLAAI